MQHVETARRRDARLAIQQLGFRQPARAVMTERVLYQVLYWVWVYA